MSESRSIRSKKRLANKIEIRGVTMPPCGYCSSKDLKYVVSLDSRKYNNCARYQRGNYNISKSVIKLFEKSIESGPVFAQKKSLPKKP